MKKCQSPGLSQVKQALQVQYDLSNGNGNVSYDFIANSLAIQATNLQEYQPPGNNERGKRNASGLSSAPQPDSGIHDKQGNIFTGFYKDFFKMSDEDKDAVIKERKRLGITPRKKKQPGKHQHNGRKASAIKSKKTALKKLNRKISAAKTKLKEKKVKFDVESSSEDDSEVQNDAGNEFSGRQTKKKKAKRNEE
jgi:hypothetical protein